MRKQWMVFIGTGLCIFTSLGTVLAASLNEWTFENDSAGLTLSQTTNSGIEQAVFFSGGTGFLETDGNGNLVCTFNGETNDMWSFGTALAADITNVTAGVQYLRYDLVYNLPTAGKAPAALGFSFVDSSGTNIAGVFLTAGQPVTPVGHTTTAMNIDLDLTGKMSAIVKVDMAAQTASVWYDLSGSNDFTESSSACTVPIRLTSIDELRFLAAGVVSSSGSVDSVSIDNIRTCATWSEAVSPLKIALSVHPLFSDNMVLQRNRIVPIWGHITPGAVVTVKLDGTAVGTATANSAGRWRVDMPAHAHDGGIAHVLTVSAEGESDIQLSEVVYGEVFIASGQSNMARFMNSGVFNYGAELVTADNYPLVRQITLNTNSSSAELDEPVLSYAWRRCSSSSLPGFTATGYFFAKEVYEQSGIPVGLLYSAWGGQMIERFLNPEGMEAVPELSGMLQYREQGGLSNLYDIYNAMIVSIMPYGVRGAIWYQGESNNGDGDIYRYKMQALMRGWRQKWGQGDFPFYYVQLAGYGADVAWPVLRQAQLETLSETNTGMSVAIEIGTSNNIHPSNKYDTGRRLAQWTLAKDLGYEKNYSGPLYRSSVIEGSRIRVLFDYADSGLIVGQKYGIEPVTSVSGPLQNFQIAGSDKNFVDAHAVIDRDTVIVSNSAVSSPVYVRYCYQMWPSGSNFLYNTDGLPAAPFRTDANYDLYVISGIAGTNWLAEGKQTAISADTAPAGKVFDRWIGAASEIDGLNSATATLTMPAHSLYLLATYRNESDPVFTLTVNGGYGSGTSQSNSILNIEAAAVDGQAFDHWSGDTQTVVNVAASRTTLRMPTNNVTVTAVYRTIDSVGDGIADTWRALYFGGNGTTTNSQSASGADPDEDGMSNLQEYYAGTSPVDALSVLRLGDIISGKDMTLSFSSIGGRRYRLETTDSLTAPQWETVLYNIVGDGRQKLSQFNLGVSSNRFYRLRLIAE